jgi:hypothetical protein
MDTLPNYVIDLIAGHSDVEAMHRLACVSRWARELIQTEGPYHTYGELTVYASKYKKQVVGLLKCKPKIKRLTIVQDSAQEGITVNRMLDGLARCQSIGPFTEHVSIHVRPGATTADSIDVARITIMTPKLKTFEFSACPGTHVDFRHGLGSHVASDYFAAQRKTVARALIHWTSKM